MPYRLSVSEKSVQQFVNALVRTCFLKAHVLVNEQSTNENLQRLQGNLAAFMQQLNAQWITRLIASFEQYIVRIQQIQADHEAAQQLLWTQIDNLNKERPLIVPVGMASTTDEFNRLLEEYKKLTIKINIFNYFIFSLDEMLKNIQQYFSQGVFGQGDHFEYSEAFLKQSTELCPKAEVDILNFFNSFSPIPKQTAQASSSSSYEQRLAKVLEKKAKIAKTMNDAQVNVSQTASSTYLPQYNSSSSQSSSSSSTTATIQAPPRVDSLHVRASLATK